MAEENERLKKATFKAFLILQVCQELKLDELAEKLHVDRDKFEKALRKVANFRIRKVKGEKIVSLQYTGLPLENFYYHPAVLWGLREPEKVKGGNDLFRKLLSVDGERKVAIFFHQLPDSRILAIERRKLEEKPGLYAFLPLRREQIKLEEDEAKGLMIKVDLNDPETLREFLLLRELLNVEGEWEYLGIYMVGFSNELIKNALDQGGFIIEEIEERV